MPSISCPARRFLPVMLAASLCLSQAVAAAVSQHSFTLPMGPHAVGFQSRQEADATRPYWSGHHSPPDATARPMHVHLWYPAAAHRGAPLQYGDYVSLYLGDEGPVANASTPRAALQQLSRDWGLPGEAPDAELQAPTHAFRDAPPASGRFPLIVYAPSLDGVAWENSVLCEYLASQGYVVLAVPSHGSRSAQMTADAVGVEAQVRDIEWLMAYAARLPFADRQQLALMGWSWGGLASVLTKTRRDDIDAIVELDGSIGYPPHYEKFVAFPGASESRIDVPLIFLQQASVATDPPLSDLAPRHAAEPPAFFQKLDYSEAIWVRMPQLMHEEFSAAGHRLERPPYLKTSEGQSWHEVAAASRGYEIVATYVLQFLEAHLRQSAAAKAWLAETPRSHGFQESEVAAVVRREPVGPAPNVSAFARQLKAMTLEALMQTYQELQKAGSYPLPQAEVLAWADGLARGGRFEEALTVLRFDAATHGNAAESLLRVASMAARAGNQALNVATLKEVLARDPANAQAAWLLKAATP